jgi:hypothetical protein
MFGTIVMLGTDMSHAKRPKIRGKRTNRGRTEPTESRIAETLTIAWTVSVTGALIADLMLLGARLLVIRNPEAVQLQMLEGILLSLAAGMGLISVVLLVAAWRSRTLKPPPSYVVFAALIAAAPLVVLLGRLSR